MHEQQLPLSWQIAALVVLLVLSAFFSADPITSLVDCKQLVLLLKESHAGWRVCGLDR